MESYVNDDMPDYADTASSHRGNFLWAFAG